jgi:predicted ATP-grasp superfamily ATP-dependent carboligase
VLLASASYGGTIAAVRNLSAAGLKVSVISSSRLGLCAAAWSRHARRTYSGPPENENARFLERLLEIGAANPGQLLMSTCDETAWLYTERAAELAQYFCLYQPPVATMRRILDKHLFTAAAVKVGLDVLPNWEPRTSAEVAALAPGLAYPILIKRRTHVHRRTNDKGVVVRTKEELIRQYQRYLERDRMRATGCDLAPESGLPFLQQFVNVAGEGVCSVSGFIDRSGELFVTRRSTKVMQRSMPVGVGVCFESLPPDPRLSEGVQRLCVELGYFGLFEVEFLKFNGSWAVIDFNPRLFNQIGMDIRRGMPLPLLACLDAAGEREALRKAVSAARQDHDARTVFCDGFTLRAILTARMLTGRITRQELSYWRDWIRQPGAHVVDVVKDERDSIPAYIHALSEIGRGIRSIGKFLRLTPRTSLRIADASMGAPS